jgi:hypothetical protein
MAPVKGRSGGAGGSDEKRNARTRNRVKIPSEEGCSVKIVVLGIVMTFPLTIFLPQAMCQASETGQKHIAAGSVALATDSIEQGPHYPSVIQLRGHVEIRTPVCLPTGRRGEFEQACDGVMIVRADEAEFHENTGEIEAHGNVSITPRHHEPAKK